jgi:hypothetical protein
MDCFISRAEKPLQRGGEEHMVSYTFIRVYKIPADNEYQAMNRMLEALALHVEKDFHVIDIIREPGAKSGQGDVVDLTPPPGWKKLFRQQLNRK